MAGAWSSSTGHRHRQRESDVEGAAHPEMVNSSSRLLCVRRRTRSVHLRLFSDYCHHWTDLLFPRILYTTSLSVWSSVCALNSFTAYSFELFCTASFSSGRSRILYFVRDGAKRERTTVFSTTSPPFSSLHYLLSRAPALLRFTFTSFAEIHWGFEACCNFSSGVRGACPAITAFRCYCEAKKRVWWRLYMIIFCWPKFCNWREVNL